MERTDWIDQGYDSAAARFLMLTAITHHQFDSPIWGQDEVRKLHLELTEIDLLTTQAAVEHAAGRARRRLERALLERARIVAVPASPMPASPAGSDADEVLMRCLLVDDNDAFVEIARRVLDPNGVKVTGTASNSAEAVLRVSQLRPDIVLIDVMLGDENGFDLARRLAELDARDLAVIMISTGTEDDYTDLMARSTALGFLTKEELSVDGIRRLLGEVR
jgi:CheY-like chemotaxis protein